ncbi:MAG TPA: hypothetical protein VN325_33480 [Steroidobacteraceae bacterium]|nr:hypothetical protein [Steroidobacteraceae bacterium]
MILLKDHFIAKLMAFKGDDETQEAMVAIEITEAPGEDVEIAFDDRGEKVYLRFRLADLQMAVLRSRATEK